MIQNSLKSISLFYLRMILVWIIAALFFMFLRNFGVDEKPAEKIIGMRTSPSLFFLATIALGTLAGILYATVEWVSERPYFLRHSLGRIILAKLIIFFLAGKFVLGTTIIFVASFTDALLGRADVITILRSPIYWVFFVFFLFVAGLITFIRMVSGKFGPGILRNMLTGKYRNPREEGRIFMFLDLKSSTTIAEKLGHLQFSRLIQDCFADLTPVINQHQVEIYQYVGDEAILSWPLEQGFEQNHCIHCYFDYVDLLKAKADYYQKQYEVLPTFKAGVHLGKVTVAEVGLVKREIAYHGDVLNTTARIQGMCNELNHSLLISSRLRQNLSEDSSIQQHPLGEQVLKGKKQLVSIYGVTKSETAR